MRNPDEVYQYIGSFILNPNVGGWGYSILVGGIPTPLKNMSSSIGMIIPNIYIKLYIYMYIIWKNKNHVPNDQSEFNNLGTREHPQTSVDLTP